MADNAIVRRQFNKIVRRRNKIWQTTLLSAADLINMGDDAIVRPPKNKYGRGRYFTPPIK